MEIKINPEKLQELYPEWSGDAIAVPHYSINNGVTIKPVTHNGPVELLVTQYKGCTVHTALNLSQCTVMVSKYINSKPHRTSFKIGYDGDILSKVDLSVAYLDKLTDDLATNVTVSVKLEAVCPHCSHKNSYEAMSYGSVKCIEDDAMYEMDDPSVSLDCLNCKKPITVSINPHSLL